MNEIFLILCIFIILTTCNAYDYLHLFLSLRTLTNGNFELSLNIINERQINRPMTDYIFTGTLENIDKVLYNSRNNIEKIKNENHHWVYIPNTCNFKDVKYFSNKTIFLTSNLCHNNRTFYENYSDYTFTFIFGFNDYINKIEKTNFYYAKVGRRAEKDIYLILGIIFAVNLITGIICAVITNKRIKKIIALPINIINYHLYYILLGINMFNVFIIFLNSPSMTIIAEYVFLIGHSFFKTQLYTCILLLLQGWMLINFSLGLKFKKYFWYILLYDLGFSLVLNLSLYLFQITSKLNLYFFKSDLEQIAFMSYLIYSIFKILIPLYKQKKIEERRRSDFVECVTFKYEKMLKLYVFSGICSVIIFIFPFIEHALLHGYIYDFNFHYILNVIYELICCVGLNFILLSNILPRYFFESIIYNYKEISGLTADITEDNDKNKLNISQLTSSNLNKTMKEGSPILFINPFASTKNSSVFNKLLIGIATNNK